MLERFKNGYRTDFEVIAQEISRTQHGILGPNFLKKIQHDFEERELFDGIYERTLAFDTNSNELRIDLKKLDETMMRAIFFITPKLQKTLKQIHNKKSAQ